MPTIKGTASVVDDHAMAKQLKQTKFPEIFSKKVNLKMVNIPVMSEWIEKKIEELLGLEDEIVASTAINLFLEPQELTDPRRAQLNLVGFLTDEKAATFAESLWALLLDAQNQSSGIPKKLLEEKKADMKKQKEKEPRNPLRRNERDPHADITGQGGDQIRNRCVYDGNFRRRDSHGHRPPPPFPQWNRQELNFRPDRPLAVSPRRGTVDEFGRTLVPEDEEDDDFRKPRASNKIYDRRYHREMVSYSETDYRQQPERYRGHHHDSQHRNHFRNESEFGRRRHQSFERRRRRSPSSGSHSRSHSASSRSLSASRSRSRSRSIC